MIRYTTPTAILVATLALAGCGNSRQPAAAGNDSPQRATATSATGGQCNAYVAAIRNVCLDSITRKLDMSCNSQLIALGVAQDQAAGNLFDVGSEKANAKVVEAVCGKYLGSLQKKRKEKDADMAAKDSAGPMCTALATDFDAKCMANLGQEKLSDQCGNAASMMSAVRRSLPGEEGCKAVNQMLSADKD